MKRVVLVIAAGFGMAGPGAWTRVHGAEESRPIRLVQASDLAAIERAGGLEGIGSAVVRVWARAGDEWSLAIKGDTLTLRRRSRSDDPDARWTTVGKINPEASKRLKIAIEDEPVKAAENQAKDGKSRSKKRVEPPPSPVPALIAFVAPGAESTEPVLDILRGRVETTSPLLDLRRERIRTNNEGVNFQAPSSAQAWHKRAAQVRDQLMVTLGLLPGFERTNLEARVYGKLDRGDYTIEKVVLETFPGFTLSGNLYRPAHASGKLPAVLCPHGHWEIGRMQPDVQMRCVRLAKLGFVVFMYDMVGYNDSKPFPHEFLNTRLRQYGLSLPTLQTWNSMRALDWISNLPDVDAARIGCTGESGGGTQTFLLTALDPRVAVAAPVVMVSDSFQGGCVCENAAGLRIGTDNVEIAALTAPRPLMMVGASGDWTKLTMTRAYPAIRGVYALVGKLDRVSARVFDFPHNYNETSRNAVYPFLARWLAGLEDESATREGKQTPETADVLSTWDSDHPRPSDRKSPEQLEAYLVDELEKRLSACSPLHPLAWPAGQRMLRTIHAVRVGLSMPAPERLVEESLRRVPRVGFTIEHFTLGRIHQGDAIPTVRLTPRKASGRATVLASDRGKAALVDARGEPSPLVRALLAEGETVIGFDPLFVGESLDPAAPRPARPTTVHFDTYNPTRAADQMQDLATVISWTSSRPSVRATSLAAIGNAGPQALLALPALAGLARVYLDLDALPNLDAESAIDPGLDLPGLRQFGGFRVAAALAAPVPLWLDPGQNSFEVDWARESYEQAGAEGAFLFQEARSPVEIARYLTRGESPAK